MLGNNYQRGLGSNLLNQLLKKDPLLRPPCWRMGPFQGWEATHCCPPHSRSAWPITYHPGLAAEVVDRVEGVDSRQPSVLEADDQASVVFTQSHAVSVLTD